MLLLLLVCVCCSLPLLHVTLRLEAIAGGLWPEPAEPAGDTTRVVMCLRGAISAAAKDSTSGVVAGAAWPGGGGFLAQGLRAV